MASGKPLRSCKTGAAPGLDPAHCRGMRELPSHLTESTKPAAELVQPKQWHQGHYKSITPPHFVSGLTLGAGEVDQSRRAAAIRPRRPSVRLSQPRLDSAIVTPTKTNSEKEPCIEELSQTKAAKHPTTPGHDPCRARGWCTHIGRRSVRWS